MSKKPFNKFIVKEESGAKKKERIRQEKKQARKETQAYFEEKKRFARHGYIERTENRQENKRPSSFQKRSGGNAAGPASRTPIKKQGEGSAHEPKRGNDQFKQPARRSSEGSATGKPAGNKQPVKKQSHPSGPDKGSPRPQPFVKKQAVPSKAATGQRSAEPAKKQEHTSSMPLNKFIAHAGICARRDAAELVRTGKVMVNGQNITEPGFKVSGQDDIKVNGKKIGLRKNLVYILLNKPKDYITTTEDPQGRKTVLDIIQRATPERVYPIGRLDRNTTGVLLFTNDGELAQKLSHPSYEVRKIYEVTLDKPLAKKDFDTLLGGITLEDGLISPDALAYADPKNKAVIGIEIHSGRNRIVRRIFEHLGYDVRNLDRVMYANLTKKNVERGKWRFLTEKEVRLLKFLNASYSKKH